ncbi:P-loop NTPase fold protein [Alloalcanivorax gelatiniphagus]
MRKENNKFFDVAIVALASMVVGISFYETYPLVDYLGNLIAEGVLWSLLVSAAFGWALFIVIAHYDRRILRLADTALPEELRSNQHAYNVLVECVDSEDAIDGAIKLIGRWGIGKTYFVKKIFSDFLKMKRAAYVSVAGIKSYEELEVAILSEVAPSFWREQGLVFNRFLSGMTSSFGGRSSAYFKMIVSNCGRLVIILDDVERVGECFKNNFYETVYRLMLDTGVVVVYLCNEEEERASQHDLYMRSKEKFIKETVTIKSCLNAIVRAKVDEIKSDKSLSEIVQIAEENLLSVLEKSDISSIRVWQQALEDGHRFLICARDEGIINSDSAPGWLLRVVVLRAESYSGNLDFESMCQYRPFYKKDNNTKEDVREANNKIGKRISLYSNLDIFGYHLSPREDWGNPLISFMFREAAPVSSDNVFRNVAWFAFGKENKPGWYGLWRWRQLYMAGLRVALERVSSQLRRDEYSEPPRVSRRLQYLREWSHDQIQKVFP